MSPVDASMRYQARQSGHVPMRRAHQLLIGLVDVQRGFASSALELVERSSSDGSADQVQRDQNGSHDRPCPDVKGGVKQDIETAAVQCHK